MSEANQRYNFSRISQNNFLRPKKNDKPSNKHKNPLGVSCRRQLLYSSELRVPGTCPYAHPDIPPYAALIFTVKLIKVL